MMGTDTSKHRTVTIGPKAYERLIKLVKHFEPEYKNDIHFPPNAVILFDTTFIPDYPSVAEIHEQEERRDLLHKQLEEQVRIYEKIYKVYLEAGMKEKVGQGSFEEVNAAANKVDTVLADMRDILKELDALK